MLQTVVVEMENHADGVYDIQHNLNSFAVLPIIAYIVNPDGTVEVATGQNANPNSRDNIQFQIGSITSEPVRYKFVVTAFVPGF